jgi:hypothetical protein
MKTRAALIVAALGTASSVFGQAQTQGTMTYTLQYAVATPTGPAGSPWASATVGAFGTAGAILNPGQGLVLRITGTLSGTAAGIAHDTNGSATGLPLGTHLTWNPSTPGIPTGSSGSGGLAGLSSGDVNIVGDGGAGSASGTWSDGSSNFASNVKRTITTWTAGNEFGYVNGDHNGAGAASRVTDIQPAVFTDNADSVPHVNTANFWKGLWIPSSYGARTVSWAVTLGDLLFQSKVAAMDDGYAGGYTTPIPLTVQTNFGNALTVGIVPSPSSLALLGLGGLIATRRRR